MGTIRWTSFSNILHFVVRLTRNTTFTTCETKVYFSIFLLVFVITYKIRIDCIGNVGYPSGFSIRIKDTIQVLGIRSV